MRRHQRKTSRSAARQRRHKGDRHADGRGQYLHEPAGHGLPADPGHRGVRLPVSHSGRIVGRVIASVFFLMMSAFGLSASEVVVLQGGARIELQKPPVRQANAVLLTRSDGLLLSVPAADIDWKATAAAMNTTRAPAKAGAAVQAPLESPAQAARAGRDGPKARVKLTDADVAHVAEEELVAGEKAKKESEARSGLAEGRRVRAGEGRRQTHPVRLHRCLVPALPSARRGGVRRPPDRVPGQQQISALARRGPQARGWEEPARDRRARGPVFRQRLPPTLVVATPDGRLIARLVGYPGRESLLHFLRESSR